MSVRQPLVIYGNGLLETSRLSHYKKAFIFTSVGEKPVAWREFDSHFGKINLPCIKKQNVKPVIYKSFFKESF